MTNDELRDYAGQLIGSPEHSPLARAIVDLLDDYAEVDETFEAMRMAMLGQGVELPEGVDPVAKLEEVMARYAFVRDTFNAREEFDFDGDDHMVKMLGVLAQGDRALWFKWKVVGVLRKAGAVGEDAVKMEDDKLLLILGMMMP